MLDAPYKEPGEIEKSASSSTAPHIMSWSIRTSEMERTNIRIIHRTLLGIPLVICSFITWNMWGSIIDDIGLWLTLCISITAMNLLAIAMFMQKTVFNYRIHLDYGELDHQFYFPEFAGGLFKSIAGLTIVVFVFVAILTGSLLFLLGPVAVALGSALKLMNWERPPVEYEKSMPWGNHHFVTVDRKYRIIVVHTTDITTGFKARFPNKDLFEQYLAFLRTVVAPNAEFTEKVWKW